MNQRDYSRLPEFDPLKSLMTALLECVADVSLTACRSILNPAAGQKKRRCRSTAKFREETSKKQRA